MFHFFIDFLPKSPLRCYYINGAAKLRREKKKEIFLRGLE
jgi:hypothetical protein